MRRGIDQHRPSPTRQVGNKVDILFARQVFASILQEMSKYPHQEEGGKFIGYVFKPGESAPGALRLNQHAHTILVTDFLPSGPKAVRTAVEFLPDGEYQEALFRRIEKIDPAIEHVGTWHSHHCNGLETLSGGDINGYLRTVNRPEYRLDHFLASLVKRMPTDSDRLDWIDHFLFVRGIDDHYNATRQVRVVEWPTKSGELTGHSEDHARRFGSAVVPDDPEAGKRGNLWYETEEGRRVLAEDKRLFTRQFGNDVIATRRGARIILTGHVGHKTISIIYPETQGSQRIAISVAENRSTVLDIACELSHRSIGFAAAVAALEAFSVAKHGGASIE